MLRRATRYIAIFIILFGAISAQKVFCEEINLDNLSSSINILDSSDNVKLTRGGYTYTLTKKEILNNKKYVVFDMDKIGFTPEHKASPDDAYCKYLEIIPADDESAVRAMNMLKESFKNGSFEMEVTDAAKAQQIMSDMNHFNDAKVIVGILPANDSVKGLSKQIKAKNTIKVSGIRFKHSEVTNNGKKEDPSFCLKRKDVFYITKLEIE